MNEKENYQELLRNPLWIGKRNEILSRDNNTCQLCGANDKYMHVHHKYYINGRKPWEYCNNSLITVCDSCHTYLHSAFVSELDGIRVGDIYGKYHSDWHNTGVVYAIDKCASLVFILESDDGVSENEFYNETVRVEDFKKRYHKEFNKSDWNYLFPRWFLNNINNPKAPSLFKLNIVELIISNDKLMQILNHTIDYDG